MQRTTPPFRADHVGSLLRTAPLKDARAKRAQGAITAAQLKDVEDREIEKVIKKQEDIGLQLATDGEFRRSWWHFDFFRGLDGVTPFTTEGGIQFHGVQTKAEGIKITGKIGFSGHPMLEHFKFLKSAYAGHAEDDDPGAVDVPFPPGPRRDQPGDLSRRSIRSSTILPRPIARRSAPSTMPAAAICSSTIPPGRWCAIRTSARNRRRAATIPMRCRSATRNSPTRRLPASRPT